MGHGMAGVRCEGAATCGVYASAQLVGRRGVGTVALRPVGARHVAPRKRAGKAVPRHTNRRAEAGLGVRAQRSRGAATCDIGAGALWSARLPTPIQPSTV
jgi:hypothetical protein